MRILIKKARVVDACNNLDEILDVLVEGEKICLIDKEIKVDEAQIINAQGKILMPGIVDMHVHLREPGREDKETVFSGTKAALKGGITSLLAMPNTDPPMDSVENVKLLKEIIKRSSLCNVFISGTITKGRKGQELTDIAGLKKEGVIAITDDGLSVDKEELLLEALSIAKKEGVLVICHCEDKALSKNGQVNLGFTSTRMGLRGIPKEAEYKRVKRDIELAKRIDAPIHIAHVSCKESVQIIAEAKKEGIKVTADTCPHYFSLTEEAVLGYDTNMKMNPPLRSKIDILAIKEGLKEGIIDAISSDHAPHTANEKEIEFERAEFGVIGLETELAVVITELLRNGILDWKALVERFCLNPARILGIDKGTLTKNKDADIIIVDPEETWIVKKEDLISKSKNSCFLGKRLYGRVKYVILKGKIVYQEE